MSDFFISYTAADKAWAEWIAFVLEEQGFTVTFQAWDFRPGSNFVLEMQKAATEASRTIMVLSPDYLKSQFASPEWAAPFSQDPQGFKRAIVPVRVRECRAPGLLSSLVHIDLVDTGEETARARLLEGVNPNRSKPTQRPKFPGAVNDPPKANFPGAGSATFSAPSTYIPNLKRAASDVDKRRFVKSTFEAIGSHFESSLAELARNSEAIDCDFELVTAVEFVAEIFLNGKSKCRCRIRLGGLMSDNGITFAEGSTRNMDNSYNEILSLVAEGAELFFSALMDTGIGNRQNQFNSKRMTQSEAADYLWRRFVAPLER